MAVVNVGLIYVLVPLRVGWRPRSIQTVYRIIDRLRPWGMLEVYMLGVLVAIVKLSELASIELGVAFWCYAALILDTAAAASSLQADLIWTRLEEDR